jgi:serine/threonine-protein kinase HipA
MGRAATAQNLWSQSARFLLDRGRAELIVEEMEAQVKGAWYETARAHGVSERDCDLISGAFAYPGFRVPAEPFP